MIRRHCVLLASSIALAGCGSIDTFRSEKIDLPSQYGESLHAGERSAAAIPWDEIFPDPALRSLIKEALDNGPDALLAMAQVKEYAAIARVARGAQFPSLQYSLTTSPVARESGQNSASSYFSGVGAIWEIDLWGRYARATEASRADWLASTENSHGVTASLVGSVANLYYTIAALDRTAEVVRAVADNQREGLKIIQRQSRAGVLSAAEERQQESALVATEALLPAISQKRVQAENQLALLLGRIPGVGSVNVPEVTVSPAEVPSGVPSELLLRRPDIRGAEARLRAAHARVEIARTLFFPDISLTGAVGSASTSLADALNGNGAKITSIGPQANLPLFSGGALRANRDAAKARRDQAVISYHQVIRSAFGEVAGDLHAIRTSAELRQIQSRRTEVAIEARRLAELRFRAGTTSFVELLDAQRQVLASQSDLIQAELSERQARVDLYLALGGGWGESR